MNKTIPYTPSPARITWLERKFHTGLPIGMLSFYLERLEGTIYRLDAKLKDIPEEILSHQPDAKWSVKQNIGHLAEVDEIALIRIDEMIRGISPMSPAVFQPRQDFNAQPVGAVLKYFTMNRLKNLSRYATLTNDELSRPSLHPRLNVRMTPVDLAFFDAEHDDHHLVRITEIITLLQP